MMRTLLSLAILPLATALAAQPPALNVHLPPASSSGQLSSASQPIPANLADGFADDFLQPDPFADQVPPATRGSCGVVAYDNQYNGSGFYLGIGANARVADDCQLVGYNRAVCEVSSQIVNNNATPATIVLELWDACPQSVGANLLYASPPIGLSPGLNDVSVNPPLVVVPNTVWVGWTTPNNNVGPRISELAEVGFTSTRFGYDTCGGPTPSCNCQFGSLFGGFDVTISAVETPQACCLPDQTCAEITPSVCLALGGVPHVGIGCTGVVCPPTCTSDALFAQPPASSGSWAVAFSESGPGFLVYEDFIVNQPICELTFWGLPAEFDGSGFVPCDEDPVSAQIIFYAADPNSGLPNGDVCTYDLDLTPVDTGLDYGLGNLIQYSASLSPCCTLPVGWVSVQGVDDPNCRLGWISVSPGNGLDEVALQLNGATLGLNPYDHALCLRSANNLSLESAGCQDDAFPGSPGTQVVVELWARNLAQPTTGCQAFLAFDDATLQFNAALSSYDNGFFSQHVGGSAPALVGAGQINVDGSAAFNDPGTTADTRLAVLVFDVLSECGQTTVGYRANPPFTSELSADGDAIATALFDSPGIYLDDTPPALSCSASDALTVGPTATVPFTATLTDACCVEIGIANISVNASVTSGNGAAGVPAVTLTQIDPQTVQIDGTVEISAITGCPVEVEIAIDGNDCCGNAAATCIAMATVSDNTAPVVTCALSAANADGTCVAQLPFTATVTDDVCADASSLDLVGTANVLTSNATVDGVFFDPPVNMGPGVVEVTGYVQVSGLTGCPATVELTITAEDCCDNVSAACISSADANDVTAPAFTTFPADDSYECVEDVPAPDTNLVAASDNCGGVLITHEGDVQSGAGCVGDPLIITRTYRATDACGNFVDADQTFTVADVTAPVVSCPGDITVNADAGLCTAVVPVSLSPETFDNQPPTATPQTAGFWYTDRYRPAVFESADFGGGRRLHIGISAADSSTNRPSGFGSTFYNTQGRKYDFNVPIATTISADLYIGADWDSNLRRAGLWGTARYPDPNDPNVTDLTYPIVDFANNDPNDDHNADPNAAVARFRVWNASVGAWIDLGLPAGFVFDQWVHFEIECTATAFNYTIVTDQGTLTYSDSDNDGATTLENVIIQAYNFGDDYDVYWDNVSLPAVATDNCSGPVVITYERSDNASLTLADPFPAGTTTVTWTGVDGCGNSSTCTQDVTVNPVNDVVLSVELTSVFVPTTRCLHFVPLAGPCGSAVDVPVSFIDHDANPATPVRAENVTIEAPCGVWTELCVKDEQHTRYATTTLSLSGTQYVADTPVIMLASGDTDNDSDIDINDVTWLLFQFGQLAADGGCAWDGTRDADFSNNGNVGSEDYNILASNWLTISQCACGVLASSEPSRPADRGAAAGTPAGLAQPTAVLASIAAADLPAAVARKVDLNRDGVVDVADVRLFEQAQGLPDTLSRAMRRSLGNSALRP